MPIKVKAGMMYYGEIETAHPGYIGSTDTFNVGTLKVSVEGINKPLLILMAKWHMPNSTQPKHRLQLLIYSMIEFYRSMRNINSLCCGY